MMSPMSTDKAAHTFTNTSMLTYSFFASFVMEDELNPAASWKAICQGLF